MGCETLDRDYSIFDNYKQYVGETGVGYARLQSGWAKSEPEKGKYNFEWLGGASEGRTKFTRLPLWDAPVLIINRDEIAWN